MTDGTGRDLGRALVTRAGLPAAVERFLASGAVDCLVLGDGTQSRAVASELAATLGTRLPPLRMIDETGSTLESRSLYFADHPPRGLWRWVPLSLQTPGEPHDDYAALVLARRWLKTVGHAGRGQETKTC
ncbi:MAG: resolvase [Candidatus Riflebacteria bacterium]|nr:resolvase [Candidatus Riflebacteria bacterium]